MSKEKIIDIVKKAASDKAFAEKLFANTEEAVAGMGLNDQEIQFLKSLKKENAGQFAFDLEQRINKDDDWWVGSVAD